MSEYYNAKRIRNLYNPDDNKPYKISRSKLELFIECPRCFYIDRRLGISRPPGFPFNLNSAVDNLLKNEFDKYRMKKTKHPLIKKNKIDAIPFYNKDFDKWRENFKGIEYLHEKTNLLITGAIDDLWYNSKEELIVVDYKSTSKKEQITSIDQNWQDSYKRQMEIYQWLLRKNNYKVSNISYFVYCNGDKNKPLFNSKLEFDVTLISYEGNSDWVENTIYKIYDCLNKNNIPMSNENCDYCSYFNAVRELNDWTKF